MSAREDILGRLRAALGRTADNRAAALAEVAALLSARAAGVRPPLATDLLARFRNESERMSSTIGEVASLHEVPAAVGHYLDAAGLPRRAVIWPRLAALEWSAAGVEVAARAVRDDDLVGITDCVCAIAETGTVMTCSTPASPAATSLLPETHIAIVPVSRLVAGMEEAWVRVRAEFGERLPRAVNLISGPSRTGDIEMTIVLGAHGPYRVHLLLVQNA